MTSIIYGQENTNYKQLQCIGAVTVVSYYFVWPGNKKKVELLIYTPTSFSNIYNAFIGKWKSTIVPSNS